MPPRSKSASHEDTTSVTARNLASKVVQCGSYLPKGTTSVPDALNINPFSKPNPPLSPPPTERPPFTGDSIKAMIPAHCFERNTLTSFSHLFMDLVQVTALGYAATYIHLAPTPAQVALWPLYWYAQGCFMTGLWVLAHECGHQAFSDSEFINNTVGWVVHSALLVPYHSWRITHKNHHSNTCSVEKDEVFAPYSHKEMSQEMMQDVPLVHLWNIVVMLTFGWPAYIHANVTGPPIYRGESPSHFSPTSALWRGEGKEAFWQVIVSGVGVVAAMAGMVWGALTFSPAAVLAYYFLPYLVTNANLVLITYLQHTDPAVPHYREGEFTWVRGALCTVDRSYGWLLDHVFHHISDTHVVHHLFHKMPFYHAREATLAVREKLGAYYMADHTPIPMALYNTFRACRFIDDAGDTVFYKDCAAFNKVLGEKMASKDAKKGQ